MIVAFIQGCDAVCKKIQGANIIKFYANNNEMLTTLNLGFRGQYYQLRPFSCDYDAHLIRE
jgi:hypothetical protein